jgi:hypothetical protein
MARAWCRMGLRFAAGVWIVLFSGVNAPITAAEPREFVGQTREFRVSVDGKERGKCTMRIDRLDNGVDRLRVESQIRFNLAVYQYRYASTATEIWDEGRLVELESASDYNGTRYSVKAGVNGKALRVTVNGKGSQADLDTWVTSYWQLPERLDIAEKAEADRVVSIDGRSTGAKPKPQRITLLDSDRGRVLRGELFYVGDETISVAGKRRAVKHYRVVGDAQAHLWYDAGLRLVRQESIDQGHETSLELVSITDNTKTPRP